MDHGPRSTMHAPRLLLRKNRSVKLWSSEPIPNQSLAEQNLTASHFVRFCETVSRTMQRQTDTLKT